MAVIDAAELSPQVKTSAREARRRANLSKEASARADWAAIDGMRT